MASYVYATEREKFRHEAVIRGLTEVNAVLNGTIVRIEKPLSSCSPGEVLGIRFEEGKSFQYKANHTYFLGVKFLKECAKNNEEAVKLLKTL